VLNLLALVGAYTLGQPLEPNWLGQVRSCRTVGQITDLAVQKSGMAHNFFKYISTLVGHHLKGTQIVSDSKKKKKKNLPVGIR